MLMPIFSLPNRYGIGGFGKESYDFVDFLAESGCKIWQILPLVQTGYGNSPYSSVASKSYNPFFIGFDLLKKEKLVTESDLPVETNGGGYIDYGKVYFNCYSVLRKAFSRFDIENSDFKKFVKSREFYGYSLFMAIKEKFDYKPFYEWEDGFKYKDSAVLKNFEKENKYEILFWQFVQFQAKKQWFSLKKYANARGIKIMGDMPLYVAKDSVDVWENPSIYKLDENLTPTCVAGVPPDYFCQKGQLWGNPVYDYQSHKEECFSWWTNRLKSALKTYDYVRIDHFRGLDRYYEIPAYAEDATRGEWVKVPSVELFDAIRKSVGNGRIVAEDLGIIDDGVRELLRYTGYPGMKILSFAFNGESDNLYLPQNIRENCVCYTGTHDNDTLTGLIENASEWDYKNLVNGVNNSLSIQKIKQKISDNRSLASAVIKLGFFSRANAFIIPMQDILFMGTEYRINEPGTVKEQNWAVRFEKSDFKKSTAKKILTLVTESKRKG